MGYSTGEFRTNEKYSKLYEEIVDSNEFPNIRAAIQGHGHVLSAFKYKNFYSFTVGSITDLDEEHTDSWWGAKQLHGDVSQYLYGG